MEAILAVMNTTQVVVKIKPEKNFFCCSVVSTNSLCYLSPQHQPQRNVVPLLKVRIADYLLKGRERQRKWYFFEAGGVGEKVKTLHECFLSMSLKISKNW